MPGSALKLGGSLRWPCALKPALGALCRARPGVGPAQGGAVAHVISVGCRVCGHGACSGSCLLRPAPGEQQDCAERALTLDRREVELLRT